MVSVLPQVRRKFYLGDVSSLARGIYAAPEGDGGTAIYAADMDDEEIVDRTLVALPGWPRERAAKLAELYVAPLLQAFRTAGRTELFAVCLGDNVFAPRMPAFAKSRPLAGGGPCVLAKLNAGHHFGALPAVSAVDIPFAEKDDRLVWRGATTGSFTETGVRPLGSRRHLLSLMMTNRNPDIDVGFDKLVQLTERSSPIPVAVLRAVLKPRLSFAEQLRSKFLLSLEGNDVATGLKWMLHSNSCVVMPRPSVVSWGCEGLLRPFVHYVPVAWDLSDLDDVHRWCLANRDRCAEIAANGTAFMAPFLDLAGESALMAELADAYAKKVTIRERGRAATAQPSAV